MGRVADADVVEDGLTEDVPSSMVGYQRVERGTCMWSRTKTVLGRSPSGGCFKRYPSLIRFLRIFAWKVIKKIENKQRINAALNFACFLTKAQGGIKPGETSDSFRLLVCSRT